LLICREPGRADPALTLPAGAWRRWDGRFLVRAEAPGLIVGPLGHAAFARLRRVVETAIPASVAASLPAFIRAGRLVAVPGLGWAEAGAPSADQVFAPRWPLAANAFTVVCDGSDII
jgi:hypothetical protein